MSSCRSHPSSLSTFLLCGSVHAASAKFPARDIKRELVLLHRAVHIHIQITNPLDGRFFASCYVGILRTIEMRVSVNSAPTWQDQNRHASFNLDLFVICSQDARPAVWLQGNHNLDYLQDQTGCGACSNVVSDSFCERPFFDQDRGHHYDGRAG